MFASRDVVGAAGQLSFLVVGAGPFGHTRAAGLADADAEAEADAEADADGVGDAAGVTGVFAL